MTCFIDTRIIFLIFASEIKIKRMATLKIYNDIIDESEKFWYSWCGAEGVCYKDVDTFAASIPKEDDTIDIRIFCNGGNVVEGWAIYDRLRLSGKKITCTIEGKACSMATIIMLAAPKEERHAFENASILVHNPWLPCWALGEKLEAKDLENSAEEMRMWQDKMVDLYVERCGCSREDIQALMDKDMFISVDRAIELGLVADKITPISASAGKSKSVINSINKNPKSMAKEKTIEVKGSLLNQILAKLGIKAETTEDKPSDGGDGAQGSESDDVKSMELETEDGQTISVEREEGEPQVGDKASPDGTFEMPDGKTITIKDGEITDIKSDDDSEGSADGEGAEGAGDEDAVAKLQKQVNALTAERDELKAKLETAEANAKTKEERRILNAVKMAGGAQKVLGSIGSSYQPDQRTLTGKNASEKADAQSSVDAQAKAILERLKGKKAKK